jgi:bacterioferritin-associated ferredoxin
VLGSKETNALGMAEFDDSHVFVLECLLHGLSDKEIEEKAIAQYPAEHAKELIAQIPSLAESLRATTLFKTLLTD